MLTTATAAKPEPTTGRFEIVYLDSDDESWVLSDDCPLDGARHITDQVNEHGRPARLMVNGAWDVRPAVTLHRCR